MALILQFTDSLFSSIRPQYQSLVAVILLALLFFSIWRLLKGYLIFLIIIIILLPGVWPALKIIGKDIIAIAGYLLYKI